jgi:parvulin-like peptidyl-prolyl isomerase
MISERLLLQQAEGIYDMKKMQDSLVKNFKEQEKVASDEDLVVLLRAEGMTIEDLRRRLMEFNGPRSVINYEVRDKVSISDAEVETWYRDHGSELATAASVSFREIVILSEGRGMDQAMEVARVLVEEARGGADFARLAAEKSEAASKDKVLGPFQKGELHPEIESQAFSVPVGSISDPIRTEHGAHVIRVESRIEATVPPLDQVRETIFARLAEERYRSDLALYLRKLWSGADIEVARGWLDRIATDYKGYVKTAPQAELK